MILPSHRDIELTCVMASDLGRNLSAPNMNGINSSRIVQIWWQSLGNRDDWFSVFDTLQVFGFHLDVGIEGRDVYVDRLLRLLRYRLKRSRR